MNTLYLDELARLRSTSGTTGGSLLQPHSAKGRTPPGPQSTSLDRKMIPRPPMEDHLNVHTLRQGSTSDVGAMAQEMIRRATQLSHEVSSIRVPLPSEAVKGVNTASISNEDQVKGTSDKGRSASARRSRMDRLPGWRMRARSRSRSRSRSKTKRGRPGEASNGLSQDAPIKARGYLSTGDLPTGRRDPSLADLQAALRPVPLAPGAAALRPGASAAETCWQACLRGTATAVAPPSGRPKSANPKANARSSATRTTTSGKRQQAWSKSRSSTVRRSSKSKEHAAELTPSRPYGIRTPGVDAVVTPERTSRHTVRWAQNTQGPAEGEGEGEGEGESRGDASECLLGNEGGVLGGGVSSQWVPGEGGAVQLGLRPANPCDECDGPVLDGAGTEFVATSPAGRRGLLRRRAAELQDRVHGSEPLADSQGQQGLRAARDTEHRTNTSGSSRLVAAKGPTRSRAVAKGSARTRAASSYRRPRAKAMKGQHGKGEPRNTRESKKKKKKKGGRKRRQGGSGGTVAEFLVKRRSAEAQALRRAADGGERGGGGAAGEGSIAHYGASGGATDESGGLTRVGGSGTARDEVVIPLKEAQRARAQHRLAYTVLDGAAHLRRIGSAMGVDVAEEAPFTMTRRRTQGSGGGYGGLLGLALEAERLRRRQGAAMVQVQGGEGHEGREGGGGGVQGGLNEGGAMVELGRSAAPLCKQQEWQQQLKHHASAATAAARGRAAAVVAELMAGSHQFPLSNISQLNGAVPGWEQMVQAGALLAQ